MAAIDEEPGVMALAMFVGLVILGAASVLSYKYAARAEKILSWPSKQDAPLQAAIIVLVGLI